MDDLGQIPAHGTSCFQILHIADAMIDHLIHSFGQEISGVNVIGSLLTIIHWAALFTKCEQEFCAES